MPEQNLLMLCAGRTRRPGWKTLDANPDYEPDYLCGIPPLPESVMAVSWDEVEWIHGITSFYPWEAEQILRELATCTKKLILEQPDARMVDVGDHPEWVHGDPSLRDPLHMNRWSYTPSSLAMLLKMNGFTKIDIMAAHHHMPRRDFRIEASR